MTDIKTLIHLNVELEGLLKVLDSRDSAEARTLLSQKFEQYGAMLRDFLANPTPQAADEVEQIAETVAADATYVEVKDQEAVSSEVEDETDAATAAIERGEQNAHIYEEEPAPAPARPQGSLLKAFTLNDKFRFIRDMFHGNEEDFKETVAVIESMASYKEAADYLVEDLMLDPDSDEVADFLDVIAAYF